MCVEMSIFVLTFYTTFHLTQGSRATEVRNLELVYL